MTSRPDDIYPYIFHNIEMFTKYTTAIAIPDKTAESVSTCLQYLLMVYGMPEEWHSDNGSEVQGAVDVLANRYNI